MDNILSYTTKEKLKKLNQNSVAKFIFLIAFGNTERVMNDLREKANLKCAKNQLTLLIIKKLCSKCNALLRKQYLGIFAIDAILVNQ